MSGGNDTFTKVLLHFDGTNGSTTFTDSNFGGAAKTWTAGGTGTTIVTAQSEFGGASAVFNGSGFISTGDSADFDFAAGNFTLDCWVRFNALAASGTFASFITKMDVSGNVHDWLFVLDNATTPGTLKLTFAWSLDGAAQLSAPVNWTPSLNTWYHLAVVRNGSNLLYFVNGVQQGTTQTITGTIKETATSVFVGASNTGGAFNRLNGWIDEMRVSKGTARWTAGFTPPTVAYDLIVTGTFAPTEASDTATFSGTVPAHGIDAATKLLLHMEGSGQVFTDSSQYAKTIGVIGGYFQSGTAKFGSGAGQWNSGANDALVITPATPDADFAFGTGDFTIDFWFRIAGAGTAILYDGRPAATEGLYPTIYIASNVLLYYTNSTNRIVGTTTLAINTWYHAAVVRAAGVTKLYLNGVQESTSYADTNNYVNTFAGRPVIGNDGKVDTSPFNGWLDEFRVSKGVGRWTANFTPPTVAYTIDSFTGTLAATEGADVAAFSGGIRGTGTFADAEASDTAIFHGLLDKFGRLIATEASDVANFKGTYNTFVNAKTVFLLSGTSWTVPFDFIPVNRAATIGGGGGGGLTADTGGNGQAVGGGGGAWNYVENLALTPGASVNYAIGAGGGSRFLNNAGTLGGFTGGDTWFNGTSLAAASVSSQGGVGGGASPTVATVAGGIGGAAANGKGLRGFDGGRGGNNTAVFPSQGHVTGGGGAGGPNGAGVHGVDTTVATFQILGGGAGDAGSGGAGGAPGGGTGAVGQEYTQTSDGTKAGSGGGGAGQFGSGGFTVAAGTGGNFGAGGGGGAVSSPLPGTNSYRSGAGTNGAIILVWPTVKLGGLYAVEAPDVASFAGTADDPLKTGTLSVVEASDTALFLGGEIDFSSFAVTEERDSAAFFGNLKTNGVLAATEASDTATFSGNVVASGSLAATEAMDVAEFVLNSKTLGHFTITELPDSAAFAEGAFHVQGTLVVSEAADIARFNGGLKSVGGLQAIELPDVARFTGFAGIALGDLSAEEEPDIARFRGFEFQSAAILAGRIVAVAAEDRYVTVPSEDRFVSVPAEDRMVEAQED